jgi:hypothetical protein
VERFVILLSLSIKLAKMTLAFSKILPNSLFNDRVIIRRYRTSATKTVAQQTNRKLTVDVMIIQIYL